MTDAFFFLSIKSKKGFGWPVTDLFDKNLLYKVSLSNVHPFRPEIYQLEISYQSLFLGRAISVATQDMINQCWKLLCGIFMTGNHVNKKRKGLFTRPRRLNCWWDLSFIYESETKFLKFYFPLENKD